jgi:hypothetical protein
MANPPGPPGVPGGRFEGELGSNRNSLANRRFTEEEGNLGKNLAIYFCHFAEFLIHPSVVYFDVGQICPQYRAV